MTTDERINAFIALGKFIKQFSEEEEKKANNDLNALFYDQFRELVKTVHIYNPWFTEENVKAAMKALAVNLEEDSLTSWFSEYINELNDRKKTQTVAVIMAGNIPLVGFHDMLCVLISGNKFKGKLSSEDKLLMPFIAKVLIAIEPRFADYIEFTEAQLKDIDAVIATGSNNSARYFDYYFGKYPHIIRRNRNSVGVLTGFESISDLRNLGEDVFQYFGLGCRNVSKLFVPEGYMFDTFYQSIFDFQNIGNNNKYANNYEYNRTVYLMGSNPSLLDNNFLLLKEDSSYASPIGVLFYEYYADIDLLNQRLVNEKEQIQCIVSNSKEIINAIPFGQAQSPSLGDYADGIDTLQFLIGL